MECLDNIIGLTNRVCECQDIEPSSSDSGYYIDDIFEGTPLNKLGNELDCDDDILSILDEARTKAISDFKTDLMGKIMSTNSKAINYDGFLGSLHKANKIMMNSSEECGLYIGCKTRYRAANLTIKAVGMKMNQNQQYEVKLIRINDDELINTWIIDAEPGKHILKEGCITIPLYNKDTLEEFTYKLVYERGQNDRHYDTKLFCCGSPEGWDQYIYLKGYEVQNGLPKYHQKQMHGLTISLSMHCGEDWLCGYDYYTDPWGRTMAKTIQLYGILNIHKYLLNSNVINRLTLMDGETLVAKMKDLSDAINSRMDYLVGELPDKARNCWVCDPKVRVGSLIV